MERTFKIYLILIGGSITSVVEDIKAHLEKTFPKTSCEYGFESEDVLSQAFNTARGQYNSTAILDKLSKTSKNLAADRILAVVDVDLYVPDLNFVFGEAHCPGFAAVISTFRLKPEFYGHSDNALYVLRVKKEAIHELGHTVGLKHCPNRQCVMHFSNSIRDTDYKDEKFCNVCERLISEIFRKLLQ